MALRVGNTSASNLLRAAVSAKAKVDAYNDSEQAYIYDLSPKTQADYQQYADYLKGRMNSTTDPSKQLALQRTATSAYRQFNSSEISRQSLAVDYGDISNRDKYAKMLGLYQQALGTGDANLAQNIEGQLARLSVTIQNEDAAKAGGSGGGGGGSSFTKEISAAKATINDFENKIERAYQTGQPITDNGQTLYLDAKSYALNKAQALQMRHDLLSQAAQMDPSYQDDLSSLEKSSDYRGLIDSGLAQRMASDPNFDPLAIVYKQDQYGNNYRAFSPLKVGQDGKLQYGLFNKGDSPQGGQAFAVQHKINTDPNSPYVNYMYDVHPLQDAQGKTVKDTSIGEDMLGFSHGQQTGNNVLVNTAADPNAFVDAQGKLHTTTGLRATLYNDKKGGQVTPEQGAADLQNLVNAKPYDPNSLDNFLPAADNYKNFYNTFTPDSVKPALAAAAPIAGAEVRAGAGFLPGIGGLVGAGSLLQSGLDRLIGSSQLAANQRAEAAAKQRAAEEAANIAAAQRAASIAQSQQAAAASQAAGRPVVPSYNLSTNKVYGLPGAPAVPAAVQKAAQTPGTSQFTSKYLFGGKPLPF